MKKKIKKNSNKKAYIYIILDESGSMDSVRDVTINGVNEQIQQIKKDYKDSDVEPIVSFVKFESTVKPVFMHQKVSELNQITREDYKPNNMTAMYDAVGFVLNEYSAREDASKDATSCLVIVISDGQENHSSKFNAASIAEKIQNLKKTERFTITYIGANQDLSQVSKTTGIPFLNTISFTADQKGMEQMFYTANVAFSGYNCARKSLVSYSTETYFAPEETK